MFSTPLRMVLAVLLSGAQFAVFLRWMHRRIGDDEIQGAFIRGDAASLPIYKVLHIIAERQGIDLDETPIDLRSGRIKF